MLSINDCEAAETTIKTNLINRLEAEGHATPKEARNLRKADLDSVLDAVFRHCRRVMIPFAEGTLILELKH